MIVIQEVPERQFQACIICEAGGAGYQACGIAIRGADVVQNVFCGFLLQLDIATLGHRNKAVFNFAGDAARGIAEQCCELILKVIFLICLAGL